MSSQIRQNSTHSTLSESAAACLRHQLADLELSALATLEAVMADTQAPAAVRVKAALAVLQRPQFPNQTWSLPERIEPPREQQIVDAFAHAMADYRLQLHEEKVESVARNAPCPCGSGNKYKRCCGSHAPPVLDPGKGVHSR